MTTTLTNKKNSLYLLKLLSQGNISKEDILHEMGIKESTFYKHLKMIRKSGFDVVIQDNKYKILRYKEAIGFVIYELSIVAYLMFLSYTMLPNKKVRYFKNAVQKILYLANENDYITTKYKYNFYKLTRIADYYKNKITILDRYIKDKKTIKIATSTKKEYNLTPIKFGLIKGKVHLEFMDKGKNKITSVPLKDIVKIINKEDEECMTKSRETIFELYGRLAKSYLLKKDERIIDSSPERIVIANGSPDKEALFKRLLRYDVLCKVTFPKSDAKEFKTMIEKSLANLNKFQDNI